MELSARNDVVGGRTVVVLEGSVDLASVPTLQNHLATTIRERPGLVVAVDLEGVRGLDDVGSGVLLGAAGRARAAGGDVVLVASSPPIRARLDELRLDRAVTVVATVAAIGDVPPRAGSLPYTAVIFTAQRTADDELGYTAMAVEMDALAARQPGYLGVDSVRDDAGLGITVSYWTTHADALAWKRHADHLLAQQTGRDRWYSRYTVRVATVEREYGFARPADDT